MSFCRSKRISCLGRVIVNIIYNESHSPIFSPKAPFLPLQTYWKCSSYSINRPNTAMGFFGVGKCHKRAPRISDKRCGPVTCSDHLNGTKTRYFWHGTNPIMRILQKLRLAEMDCFIFNKRHGCFGGLDDSWPMFHWKSCAKRWKDLLPADQPERRRVFGSL